jgi:hypothetical protein
MASSSSNNTVTTVAVVGGAVVLAGVLGTLYARSTKKSTPPSPVHNDANGHVAVPRPVPRSLSKDNIVVCCIYSFLHLNDGSPFTHVLSIDSSSTRISRC